MGSNSIRRHRDLPSLWVCPGVVCISLCGLSLIVTFLTQKVGIVGHGFLSRAGTVLGRGACHVGGCRGVDCLGIQCDDSLSACAFGEL